jgi:hypothetical protein
MQTMIHLPHLALLALFASGPVLGQSAGGLEDRATLDLRVLHPAPTSAWDARAAEHLLNRAGFGAHTLDVRRAVRTGQKLLVRQLVRGEDDGLRFEQYPVEPDMELLRGGMRTSAGGSVIACAAPIASRARSS